MKICVLTHTFPRFSGDVAAPFMDGVSRGLVAAGNEVFVLTPWDPKFNRSNDAYQLKTYKYIWPNRFHLLGYSRTLEADLKPHWWVYFLSPLMILFGIFALYKLVRQEKIDLINVHWILPNGFIAGVVHKLTGVPVVSTLPGSDVFMAAKPYLRWMTNFAIKNSAAITSNSPQLIKDLVELGADTTRCTPIIYGVDPEKFKKDNSRTKELREKFGYEDNDVIVLAVGRLVYKKGFHYLVDAIPEVVNKYPNVRFLLIGDGDQRQNLELQTKRYKLQTNIKMPGYVSYDELLHYYNLGDIFINPSIRDKAGNLDDQNVALVEAMACGKPVIATNFPGYGIVIDDGRNGFLTKEGDAENIAQVIIRLVESKELREKMGRESRRRVEEEFSWEKIGGQYTDLFRSILIKSTRRVD